MTEFKNSFSQYDEPDGFNPDKFLKKIFKSWKYFVASIVLFLSITLIINKNSVPIYSISTAVLIEDNDSKNKLGSAVNDFFEQQNNGKIGSKNLNNEYALLKSYPLLFSTLLDFDNRFSYLKKSGFTYYDLYKGSPIRLNVIEGSLTALKNPELHFTYLGDEKFILSSDEVSIESKLGKPFAFSNKLKLQVNIVHNNIENIEVNETIKITVNDIYEQVDFYSKNLEIELAVDKSSIIEISISSPSPDKEVDFLNALVEKVIELNLNEKNTASAQVVEFIDSQLTKNSDSLNKFEYRLQNFRTKNAALDLKIEGTQLFQNIEELKQQKAELEESNNYYNYLEGYLQQNFDVGKIVIPSSVGVQDQILNRLINTLVETQLEVNILTSANKSKNPVVIEKKRQVAELKDNILNNISTQKNATSLQIENIDSRISGLSKSLSDLPEAERKLVNIQRNYELNENIYMLLMQKKLEASIRASANSSDYKIINRARAEKIPLSPKPLRNYVFAILLGIFLPISFLLIKEFLNDKIEGKDDLNNINIPYAGSIYQENINVSKKNESAFKPIENGEQKIFLESFRGLRSNLRFILKNTSKKSGKVITVTSSLSGEGKSFCSWHLANVLAIGGKKTLYINADLRKRVFSFEMERKKGLSEFLAGMADSNEIVAETSLKNLYLVQSGELPPNPSELLMGSDFENLIFSLKKDYDYIIIDSSPVGLVSDILPIMSIADLSIYIAREGYSKKSILKDTLETYIYNKFNNVYIVLNGSTQRKSRYGYGDYYFRDKKNKKGLIKMLTKTD